MLLPAGDLSRLLPFHLLPWLWLLCLTVTILIIATLSLQFTSNDADTSSTQEQKAGSFLSCLVFCNVCDVCCHQEAAADALCVAML